MVHSSKPVSRIEELECSAPRSAALPGLPDSSNAAPYKSPFFGAQRDWPNDEVGWTKVTARTLKTRADGVRIWRPTTRRDINREERKQAGWNLLELDC
jgi:hypothetical protein